MQKKICTGITGLLYMSISVAQKSKRPVALGCLFESTMLCRFRRAPGGGLPLLGNMDMDDRFRLENYTVPRIQELCATWLI